jgi:hypothetical protein
MDSKLRILIIGIMLGFLVGWIAYKLDTGDHFYIRFIGIFIGFTICTLLIRS